MDPKKTLKEAIRIQRQALLARGVEVGPTRANTRHPRHRVEFIIGTRTPRLGLYYQHRATGDLRLRVVLFSKFGQELGSDIAVLDPQNPHQPLEIARAIYRVYREGGEAR